MAPKRKSSAPTRANEGKRQAMTWNMFDGQTDEMSLGVDVIIDDTSPVIDKQPCPVKDNSVNGPSTSADRTWLSPHLAEANYIEGLLKNCCFTKPIIKRMPPKSHQWHCKLGEFKLHISSVKPEVIERIIQSNHRCCLYVDTVHGNHVMQFKKHVPDSDTEEGDSNFYVTCFTEMPSACLSLLDCYSIPLVLCGWDNDLALLTLGMHMMERALGQEVKYRYTKKKKKNLSAQRPLKEGVKRVMEYFYNFPYAVHETTGQMKNRSIDELYDAVRNRHQLAPVQLTMDVQHPCLKPRLRPYQKEAVLWMLHKERLGEDHQETAETTDTVLHQPVTLCDGQVVYYNSCIGYLLREELMVNVSPPGGILADEMGLGKTVEVLACMLIHPRTDIPKIEKRPVISANKPTKVCKGTHRNSMGAAGVVNGVHVHPKEDATEPVKEAEFLEATTPNMDIPCAGMSTMKEDVIPNMDIPCADMSTMNEDVTASMDMPCAEMSTMKDDATPNMEIPCAEMSTMNDDAIPNMEIPCAEMSTMKEDATPNMDMPCAEMSTTKEDATPDMDKYCAEMLTVKEDQLMSDTANTLESSHWKQKPDCIVEEKNNIDNTTLHPLNTELVTSKLSPSLVPQTSMKTLDISIQQVPWKKLKRKKKKRGKRVEVVCAHMSLMEEGSSWKKLSTIKEDATPNMDMCCAKMSTVKEDQSMSDTANTLESSHWMQKPDSTLNEKNITNTELSPPLVPNTSTHRPDVSVQRVPSKTRKKKKRAKSAGAKACNKKNKLAKCDKTPDEPRQKFECLCGGAGRSSDWKQRVQCEKCGLWQHADCVKYDLADPYRGPYLCPHCHVAAPPIPSGATLIITPRAISHQWVEEIEKHIQRQSLKVFVYTGMNLESFIQPLTLARQDIVITSYETLRREINYVDLPHSNSDSGRRLRHAKRFMAVPSPITAIEWWRICLDEAQMVERITTRTAEMALRLSAVNRWCVTGTPIQRDIDDLYGLLVFLGVEPYRIRFWWNKILYEPYCYGNKEALEEAIATVLWRSAKKDVLDQLALPSQTEDIHWLTFSPVEEHFYRSQYHDSTDQARKNFQKWKERKTKLSSLDRRTLHNLLHPLLRLRQACCHPQAVRGEFLSIHKSTLSMAELLIQLTKKARFECEEAHRQKVAALNGLAGLLIIKEEYIEAVEKYRSVMRSVEEYKDELRTDELQQLHTLHNLDELLKAHGSTIAPTLRDSQLTQQAKEVREKYLVKAGSAVTVTEEAWVPVHTSVSHLKKQLAKGSSWWADLIQWANYNDLDTDLVEKVREDLAAHTTLPTHISTFRFRESLGLQFLLASHIYEVSQSHDALVNHLYTLSGPPSESVVNAAVECCLRPVGELLKTCAFCKADELFQEYESKLFSFVDKGFVQPASQGDDPMYLLSTRRQGTWADSETERALKSLHSFCKNYGADRNITEYGSIHFKLLDALKKEFKCLRAIWMALREQVSAIDELSMATTRIRLRLEDEPRADPPQMNILEEHELEPQRIKLVSDQIVAECMLKKKLGQLLYLKNLAQTQDALTGGVNPEPCPICQRELGTRWSVLQCGHCFCLECIHILIQEYSFRGRHRSLKCAICRQRTMHADISYVCTRGRKALEEEVIKVKGDNSTKMEGIVQCLLQIQQQDPTAKCLVFSTWPDVLDVLAGALSLNDIPFRSLQAGHKYQKNLAVFRYDENIKVLLLPVHSGANGLNLIEATHVLLVEPILNPAQELQAIGRVHRIGQTRPTVVHRFLVRGTIEERMHSLLRHAQAPSDCHSAEDTTMTIADLMSLFEETADEPCDDAGQETGRQETGGQETGGQETGGQETGGQETDCQHHHEEVFRVRTEVTQVQEVGGQGQAADTVSGQEIRMQGPTEDTAQVQDVRVVGETEDSARPVC